jgi:hypothetical protein
MRDETTIAEYAASMSNLMLFDEFIDTIERAQTMNNSGTFKIAAILMSELHKRGFGNDMTRAYQTLIEHAVADAESKARR